MNKDILFEDLGISNDTATLQKIQSENNLFDLMYVKMSVSKHEEEFRKRIESIFQDSNKYLDNDFIGQFKLKGNFNARLRELYMTSLLLKNWYNLDKNKPKENTPDLKLDFWWKTIWIECVASTKGEWDNKILDVTNWFSWHVDIVNTPRKLRLTTALDTKMKKFNCYLLDWIVKNSDCCIIALNWWESDWDLIVNWIWSILFWYDKTIFNHVDWKLEWPYVEEKKEFENKNGAIIDHALFLSRYYSHISWIIYFWSSIVNCDDFDLEWVSNNSRGWNWKTKVQFIKNPNAKNQIPEWFMKNFWKNL